MKVRVMVNGHTPPMHHTGMPGKFRDTLFIGRRFDITIDDPEVEQAIEEALEHGFKPEVWIEAICQQ